MLEGARLGANLKVPDIDAAVEFYEGKLGLPLEERRSLMPGHEEVVFAAGGGAICVERGEGGRKDTPVSFIVDDVSAVVEELRARGVMPEEYDMPGLKTENGIATIGETKAAWIADPGGNLVGILGS